MTKEITHNRVVFTIDDETDSLMSIRVIGAYFVSEVFIPHFLPGGERIKYLSNDFCNDCFDKVIIDNGIQVNASAFRNAAVTEVVWNDCAVIPSCCFLNSSVKKVTNIKDVTKIGPSAFEGSAAEEFIWPSGCLKIPIKCFKSSSLKRISNINHITSIDSEAFAFSRIEDIVWPSKCPTVPRQCFIGTPLSKISNTDCIEEVRTNAFCLYFITNPEFSIDLSKNMVTIIEEGAFAYCKHKDIIMPYYISEEDKEKAFCVVDED